MRIGVDIDGVLADFNASFINRVIAVTGRDLFPPRPFEIPTWNYPEFYGYTQKETSLVWENVKNDPWFWGDLPAYETTAAAIECLDRQHRRGDDIYYITSRPGIAAKWQTERWLHNQWQRASKRSPVFTVLISSAKGLCAQALQLDRYIDDRWENVCDVATTSPCKAYLLDRSWNRENGADYSPRIFFLEEMFRD